MSWSASPEWWLEELASDAAYERVVAPLLIDVLQPVDNEVYLDLGCGEGRVMRAVSEKGSRVHGLDINHELAARAGGTVVVADLPLIPMRAGAYDGIYVVLTLEHVPDHGSLFAEAARVTRSGGVMALVANHPTWTAPGSTPISDTDGEVLWRPGDYFVEGVTSVPMGPVEVAFHHRSMADLLNAAAMSGWALQRMIERPHEELADQSGIPRLLACRWRLIR